MRIIGWMNGWVEVPECGRSLLWPPVRMDYAPNWMVVQVLGFAVFLARNPEEYA